MLFGEVCPENSREIPAKFCPFFREFVPKNLAKIDFFSATYQKPCLSQLKLFFRGLKSFRHSQCTLIPSPQLRWGFSYLNNSSFFVVLVSRAVATEGNNVAFNPLFGVMSALCCTSSYTSQGFKINLGKKEKSKNKYTVLLVK